MSNLNEVVEVVYRGQAGGQEIINIMHYGPTVVPPVAELTDAELQALAAALGTQWVANIMPLLHDDYVYQYTTVSACETYRVFSQSPNFQSELIRDRQFFDFSGSGSTGGLATERLPLNDAVTARKLTTNPTRAGRGSVRFGPIVEAHQEDGSLTGAALASWIAATVPLALPEGPFAPSTTTFQLIVWGPSANVDPVGVNPVNVSQMFDVTGVVVQRLVRTQQSRKPRF